MTGCQGRNYGFVCKSGVTENYVRLVQDIYEHYTTVVLLEGLKPLARQSTCV